MRSVLDTESAYAFALRFLGYGKAAHRFLCIRLYAFHPRELQSRFVSLRILSNYVTVTVGTQDPDLVTSYLQRKAFHYQGTPNFVKHVIIILCSALHFHSNATV